MLASDNSELISQVIVGHLATTDVGLEHLYKAFSGVPVVPKFKEGEVLWTNYSNCRTWNMDKDKMTEAGMIHQGKVKVKIKEIDMRRHNPYKVFHEVIDSSGKKENSDAELGEEELQPIDTFPLNL